MKLLQACERIFTKKETRFWCVSLSVCVSVNHGRTLSNINEQPLSRDEQDKGNDGKTPYFPSVVQSQDQT